MSSRLSLKLLALISIFVGLGVFVGLQVLASFKSSAKVEAAWKKEFETPFTEAEFQAVLKIFSVSEALEKLEVTNGVDKILKQAGLPSPAKMKQRFDKLLQKQKKIFTEAYKISPLACKQQIMIVFLQKCLDQNFDFYNFVSRVRVELKNLIELVIAKANIEKAALADAKEKK